MDGLRSLAVSEFEAGSGADRRFKDSIQDFSLIRGQLKNDQITIDPAKKISKTELDVEMAARVSTSSGTGPASPKLKLVQILIEDPFPFYIEKELFLRLFNALELDPYILHLVLRNSYGFHEFPARPAHTNGQVVFSYFVSTIMYMLAWSFNPATMETKAILMTRRANGKTTYVEVEHHFSKILREYANRMYSPTFLSLTAATQLVHFFDEYILDRLQSIRDVEAHTGHGDIGDIKAELGVNEIARLSKDTGRTLTVLANIHRHLLISKAVIAHASKSLDPKQLAISPTGSQDLHNKHKESLMGAVSVLDTQVTWNESYVAYLLERAKSQIAVLQTLLTHEDATQTLSLTTESTKLTSESKNLSNISTKIAIETAEIAKLTAKDSSAMKKIATMTMLFLPGTFFAALFAVPLLKWDDGSGNVVQKRFWVYWAFTLPATVLVFLVPMVFPVGGWRLRRAIGAGGEGGLLEVR